MRISAMSRSNHRQNPVKPNGQGCLCAGAAQGGAASATASGYAAGNGGPPASIGPSMSIKGDIRSKEELFIDGEIEGTIESQHRVTVGPHGKVRASVKAREVVVLGSIHGNVETVEKISIRKDGRAWWGYQNGRDRNRRRRVLQGQHRHRPERAEAAGAQTSAASAIGNGSTGLARRSGNFSIARWPTSPARGGSAPIREHCSPATSTHPG